MRLAALHTYPVKGCHRIDHDVIDVHPWGLAGDRRWLIVGPDLVGITLRQVKELVLVRPQARLGGLTLYAAGRPALDVAEPVTGEILEARAFTNREPVPVRAAGPVADRWLGELLDRPVRLVWLADPSTGPVPRPAPESDDARLSFADAQPMLVTNTASLDALNDALLEGGSLEGPLPMNRFRPNLVIAGAPRWAEDGWSRLRIGGVTFQVVKPCARCMVTTIDQETAETGREPLRVLADHRRFGSDLRFGVYLAPEQSAPGRPDPVIGRLAVGDPVEQLG